MPKADLSPYFPIFLWVLRDFHLSLVDHENESMSEKEYLEQALRLVPGQEALDEKTEGNGLIFIFIFVCVCVI